MRAALALAALLAAGPAAAVEPVALATPAGERVLDDAALRALPPVNLPVAFATHDGMESADYAGALLWRAIDGERLRDAGRLMRTVVVTGGDGHAVVLSLAEIDPEFGATPAILAYRRDGADMPVGDGPRLLVPGDTRAGRAVRDVVRIEVR